MGNLFLSYLLYRLDEYVMENKMVLKPKELNITYLNALYRFHSLVIDVTMALDTLSLPVLEPLTPGRLLDMTVLALSCLYAGRAKLSLGLIKLFCLVIQMLVTSNGPSLFLF